MSVMVGSTSHPSLSLSRRASNNLSGRSDAIGTNYRQRSQSSHEPERRTEDARTQDSNIRVTQIAFLQQPVAEEVSAGFLRARFIRSHMIRVASGLVSIRPEIVRMGTFAIRTNYLRKYTCGFLIKCIRNSHLRSVSTIFASHITCAFD